MSLNRKRSDWHGQRVWLIGASSGIGEALARVLADAGAELALSARSKDKLEAVAGSLGGALVVPFDVTEPRGYADAWTRIGERWDRCDLVVFLAGAYKPTRAWELTDEEITRTVETNLVATMRGVATVLPDFLARGGGGVALVASVAGYGGLPQACTYGPTKAALINFAETLYMDVREKGVDVYLVNPGFVETPLTADNDFEMPALMRPEEAAQAILEGIARGRFEIHFPKRFSRVLKLLQWLPRGAYFKLIKKVAGL